MTKRELKKANDALALREFRACEVLRKIGFEKKMVKSMVSVFPLRYIKYPTQKEINKLYNEEQKRWGR